MNRPVIRIALSSAVLSAVAALAIGCVPAEQYAGMKMTADKYAEQLSHAQADANAERARADSAERQLQAINNQNSSMAALASNKDQQNDELRKQNDEMERRYKEAMATMGRAGTSSPLPAKLTDDLRQFADASPDLITFDASRGTVKFKSDVAFAPGDATVTDKAKEVLHRFAAILTGGGADRYDLLVAGNTDSTPVTNQATIGRGHFNNWYLSAHRAISVGSELIADGVSARRVGMVGYGDQRPAASNATADGKAQNRRVEVILLPTSKGYSGGGASSASAAPRRRAATPEPQPARAVMGKESTPAPSMAAPLAPVAPLNK